VIRYCQRAGIPLFVCNDSNIRSEGRLPAHKQLAKRGLYGWWMPRVNGVMPMGEYGEEFFLKYGASAERMYRLPYTPAYEYFAEVDAEGLQRFCDKLGLRPDRRYFLFSGRLVEVKRVDLLIAAFSAISAQRPDWDLLVAGDGRLRDELRDSLLAELRSRVVWCGFLEQSETRLAYHAADALVLPSDREPWGVVVQEAMAAGLAVVASDVVGAAHELVEDGVSGAIFSAGSVEGLQRALSDVSQADKIDTLKANARVALEHWRQRVDPVAEMRRALSDVKILTN
jgi:glycosyltransferase involved in cell wall biosynthesis